MTPRAQTCGFSKRMAAETAKKLGRIGGSLNASCQSTHICLPSPAVALQAAGNATSGTAPTPGTGCALQKKRRAVDCAVLAVKLVGEIVQDQVLPVVDVRRAGPHVMPRNRSPRQWSTTRQVALAQTHPPERVMLPIGSTFLGQETLG